MKTSYLTVRVPEATYKKFKAVAKKRDLTVSQEIRHYIALRVEQEELLTKRGRS